MELYEGLMTRRSVRKFTGEPLDKKLIAELVEAANAAPSAHNFQPWEFLVVEDKEELKNFRNLQRYAALAEHAAAVVVVCVDEQKAFHREKDGENWNCADVDGSSATMNLLYAAHAKGLGACWCGCAPMSGAIERVKGHFGLPAHIRPVSIVVIGEIDGAYPSAPSKSAPVIHWEKW